MTTRPRFRLAFALPRLRPAVRRVARGRRARAVVLGGLLAILAAHVGLVAAVDTVVPEWRDPEYGYRLKQVRAWQRDRPDRPLVLAIGSSRTMMALSPAAMGFPDEPGSPLVYSFGQTASGPMQLMLTLSRLLDDGVRPAFLLVELFPAVLYYDAPAEELLKTFWTERLGPGDLARLAPYCGDPAVLRWQIIEPRLSPWYSFRFTLASHVIPNWLPHSARQDYRWYFDRYGWQPYPYEQIPDERRAHGIDLARKAYHHGLRYFRVGPMTDRVLRAIVERARAANVPMAFYLTPEGPAFRTLYAPETRPALAEYVASLTRGSGVPLFDAADGFAEDEFADSHHMLRGGAVRFSRRLADECLRPWLRERGGK